MTRSISSPNSSTKSCSTILWGSFLAGVGLLVDFYDFSVINIVKPVLQEEYPVEDWSSSNINSLLTASSLFGALIGQCIGGLLADKLGRRNLLLCAGVLASVGSLGSAASFNFGQYGVYYLLITFRFVMGTGIGAEYPCSASYTSENADPSESGMLVALTYSMMGVGVLLSSVIVLICEYSGAPASFTWRFAFGFGGLLSLLGLYLRFKYVFDAAKFVEVKEKQLLIKLGKAQNEAASAYQHSFKSVSKFWFPLAGTMISWLLYDILDYGLGMYSSDILSGMFGSSTAQATLGVFCINLIGLPGFFLSAFIVPRLGRKQTQILGLSGMGLVYLLFAIWYDQISSTRSGFIILYGIQLLFDNAGPGATTFIIPSEIYPTAIRGTCHGMSAASGKTGAVIGSYAMNHMIEGLGTQNTFWVLFSIAILAVVWTVVFIPKYDERHIEALDKTPEHALKILYQGQHLKRFGAVDIASRASHKAGVDDSKPPSRETFQPQCSELDLI